MTTKNDKCPYCNETLKIWEPSPYTGWGETMFYCDNNTCGYFLRGREKIFSETTKNFAYRYCYNPCNGKDFPIITWCPGELSLKRKRCATETMRGDQDAS